MMRKPPQLLRSSFGLEAQPKYSRENARSDGSRFAKSGSFRSPAAAPTERGAVHHHPGRSNWGTQKIRPKAAKSGALIQRHERHEGRRWAVQDSSPRPRACEEVLSYMT